MFTGIIEEVGALSERDGDTFTFSADKVLDGTRTGDSIAVDGVCLTAVSVKAKTWSAQVSEETYSRTCLGSLKISDGVNLERAVRVLDRLGGHVVAGHVDGRGEVITPAPDLRIRMPEELLRYVVEKGSIAINGISLTVANIYDDGFGVAIIPHTINATTVGSWKPGDLVNLEVDELARYAERISHYLTRDRLDATACASGSTTD